MGHYITRSNYQLFIDHFYWVLGSKKSLQSGKWRHVTLAFFGHLLSQVCECLLNCFLSSKKTYSNAAFSFFFYLQIELASKWGVYDEICYSKLDSWSNFSTSKTHDFVSVDYDTDFRVRFQHHIYSPLPSVVLFLTALMIGLDKQNWLLVIFTMFIAKRLKANQFCLLFRYVLYLFILFK